MTKPSAPSSGESDWERRKRLAEVFGDTLPDTTSDERDDRADAQRARIRHGPVAAGAGAPAPRLTT